jgi:hypothetical protein
MRRLTFCATLCALMLAAGTSHAAPLLRCQIDQGGTVQLIEATPVADPYTVKAVDINGRFRFKAVMIGAGNQVDYIKLYVYSQLRRQPVLLQEAKYLRPAPSASLTGIQYLYSTQLERELQYSCALLEQTGPSSAGVATEQKP